MAEQWQKIETAPKFSDWLRQPGGQAFLLAKFHTPVDEDGETGETGETELVWSHVAYISASGWMLPTRGFAGTHGYASFLLDEPTHWMRLPSPPVAERERAK